MVSTIEFAVNDVSILPGESVVVNPTARDASGARIAGASFTYSSDNESVATVSSVGRITGVAQGRTVVRASSGGVSASVDVVIVIELTGGSFATEEGGQAKLVGTSFMWNPTDASAESLLDLEVQGPEGWTGSGDNPAACDAFRVSGMAMERAFCWFLGPASGGNYSFTSRLGTQVSRVDPTVTVIPVTIGSVLSDGSDVTISWSGAVEAVSHVVVIRTEADGVVVGGTAVLAGDQQVVLHDMSLASGVGYEAVVYSFNADVLTPGPLPGSLATSQSDPVPVPLLLGS